MQFAMVSIRVWLAQYMRYRGISQTPIVINIPIKTSISAAVVANLEYKLCVALRFVSKEMWERSCSVKYMRKYSIGLRTGGISLSDSEKFHVRPLILFAGSSSCHLPCSLPSSLFVSSDHSHSTLANSLTARIVSAAPIYRSISPQGGTGVSQLKFNPSIVLLTVPGLRLFYKSAACYAAALIRCLNGPSVTGDDRTTAIKHRLVGSCGLVARSQPRFSPAVSLNWAVGEDLLPRLCVCLSCLAV
ncbi:hypothetical protein T06_4927 [Trichinella sp. T6]|nr:hypothetical protein T06_4927 [Trichinella sp. T6]